MFEMNCIGMYKKVVTNLVEKGMHGIIRKNSKWADNCAGECIILKDLVNSTEAGSSKIY